MNFSKLSVLITLALVSTLSVCLAKDAKVDDKKVVTKDESSSEKKAEMSGDEAKKVVVDDSKEAVVEDGVHGGATGSDSAGSDMDIEQLLKLIDALKNQNFNEIDETLKGSKLMKDKDGKDISIGEMIKEDEAKMTASEAEKSGKKSSGAESSKSEKSSAEDSDKFEL